jgi:hypothetical protein
MLQGYDNVVESAKHMLDFLCENFEVNEIMKEEILKLIKQ